MIKLNLFLLLLVHVLLVVNCIYTILCTSRSDVKKMRYQWRNVLLTTITFGVLYAEFLGDYIQFFQCKWPKTLEKNELRAMILADTHIIGPVRGHWLDKLYREWHMHRAFQAATFLFEPDMIFILGDLFDEGDIINHEHFLEHVQRFQSHFRVNSNMQVISAVGNHDIGFHYRLHPYFTERFEKEFNNTGVNFYTIKGIHFIVINSMAMQNDGCYFCEIALDDLTAISAQLECLKKRNCKNKDLYKRHGKYSQPILMQHFPTYRPSDEVCLQGDIPHIEQYRENWEVLSKSSTDLLGNLLKPRLAFAGHSHHFCLSTNRLGIEEYTVASFNWRNKINPSFLLAKFSATQYAVEKCDMMSQNTVFNVYIITSIVPFICFVLRCFKFKFVTIYNFLTGNNALRTFPD